jgi:tRNA(Ile)-lysidine synthase
MSGQIETILREQCKLVRDRPILVGISGGPDSLCLLSMLREAGWSVVAAHFNHMLRPEAEAEAAAVELLASQMNVPFIGGRSDVSGYAQEEKLSIESAARELRYRFLFTEARGYGAQAVAVGHTADDQVETVLMHFLRGAGLNGLRGMAYRTLLKEFDPEIALVRPLLDLWRSETVSYCELHGMQPSYDRSNDSLDFQRNRVRHELIPLLETYNPRFREALWRSGRTLSADYALLESALEPIWLRAVIRQAGRYIGLDAAYLVEQPVGLRMHLFRRAAQILIPGHDTGYTDLQRAAEFAADRTLQRADFTGGLLLMREENVLFIAHSERDLPSDQWPQMPAGEDSIPISTTTHVALDRDWQFSADRCEASELDSKQPWDESNPFRAFLDAGNLPEQLELRIPRSGDRFEPLGMDGHSQKVSDFFVNAKLPKRARGRWPLVCAGEQLIWVPGYRPAERYRLRAETTEVWRLAVIGPE